MSASANEARAADVVEMEDRLVAAMLEAYGIARRHLMDELPDTMPVSLLVRFRLGDLRRLARERTRGETTILSGG